MLCCGYTLTDFPISIRLTSLALWQSNDCPSASKATLMNMDKYFMWIHYERLHNHNKAKHNKTVCIFLGIYCRLIDILIKLSGFELCLKKQNEKETCLAGTLHFIVNQSKTYFSSSWCHTDMATIVKLLCPWLLHKYFCIRKIMHVVGTLFHFFWVENENFGLLTKQLSGTWTSNSYEFGDDHAT